MNKKRKFEEEKEFEDVDEFISFNNEIATEPKKKTKPQLLNKLLFPWLKRERHDRKAPPFVRFHNEILMFCDFLTPTQAERLKVQNLIAAISRIAKGLWSECEVQVFGSQLTEMIIPASDIDLAIVNVLQPIGMDLIELLTNLATKLKEHLQLSYLEVIFNAKVPIIKLDQAETGLSVDICINNDQGIRTGQMMIQYAQEFPMLKPLMLVLKTFLVSQIPRSYCHYYHNIMHFYLLVAEETE
jgi:non-canonical poly(A) RNA polymerase PAPD5/7